MDNTAVMDFNSTFNSTSDVFDCFKPAHVGIIVNYIALLLCFFVGTPAESWFLWLSLRDGWKIKPTQVFPLCLNMLELIYCIEGAVMMLDVLIFNSDTFSRVTYIIFGVCWIGRPLTQTCICVEQYLAVLHPIIFLKYKGVQYRIVMAVVVWLIATACTVYEAFSDISSRPIINIIIFISIAVILFCCVSVLRALKLPRPGDTQITTERRRDVGNQQKRNAFNKIFEGLLIILFSYLPQVSLYFIFMIQVDKELFYCDIIPIMSSFSILGVLITPLLKMYKDCHQKFLNYQRAAAGPSC